MSQLQKTIKNPLVGDEVSFIKTSRETNGAYCLVEVVLQPGGSTGLHYHTRFNEKFEVVRGKLGLQDGKRKFHLREGETYTIEKNRKHQFFNDGSEPVTFYCTISPAGQFEELLRVAYGLATDKKVNAKGIPKNVWHLAIMFNMGESYLPGVPLWLQKGIFNMLATIGKWKKADIALEKYYVEN
jgi:mannose-6-phosphate isomerase-like protein (cupin superfamily)